MLVTPQRGYRDVPLTVMLTRQERETLHRLAIKLGVGDSVCARMLIRQGMEGEETEAAGR